MGVVRGLAFRCKPRLPDSAKFRQGQGWVWGDAGRQPPQGPLRPPPSPRCLGGAGPEWGRGDPRRETRRGLAQVRVPPGLGKGGDAAPHPPGQRAPGGPFPRSTKLQHFGGGGRGGGEENPSHARGLFPPRLAEIPWKNQNSFI